MTETLEQIFQGVLSGDQHAVRENVQRALDAGVAPDRILHHGMIPAMAEVGERFEAGEYFVPEMLVAARAMKNGLEILKPRLVEANVEPIARAVIGTVKGDLHDIGKNLVAMMLEGAGFEIIDLGVDVDPEAFLEAVRQQKVDFLMMSALLTTTMTNMETTIEALRVASLDRSVKVVVGGAPVTQAFAARIGADGYAPDAIQAVKVSRELLGR